MKKGRERGRGHTCDGAGVGAESNVEGAVDAILLSHQLSHIHLSSLFEFCEAGVTCCVLLGRSRGVREKKGGEVEKREEESKGSTEVAVVCPDDSFHFFAFAS